MITLYYAHMHCLYLAFILVIYRLSKNKLQFETGEYFHMLRLVYC